MAGRLLGALRQRRDRTLQRLPLLTLVGTCLALPNQIPAQTSSQTHALLVGCTRYPYLSGFDLVGPANDVALTKQLLTNRFGLDEENITTLVGWPEDASSRPSRANIERELQRLASEASSGDQIVILFGGHGSQQPNTEDPADPEPDGFDELFLPADVQAWDGSRGEVENAIRDDEIKEWLSAIRDHGAFVWVIFDSCHSGTMTRGLPQDLELERRVPVEALVPEQALNELGELPDSTTRGASLSEEDILGLSPTEGSLVAIYAAQPHELTPEMPLPTRRDERYGLFSYTLNRILRQATSPLTYRQLVERVNAHYRSLGRSSPTPLIEGADLDREVLGLTRMPRPPSMLISGKSEAGYEVAAGSLQGLTPETILSVYPSADAPNSEQTIGHLRVTTVRALESIAVPVAFDGLPAPTDAELAVNNRCRIALLDFGELRLRVAVQTQEGPEPGALTTWPRGDGPPILERAFAAIETRPGPVVERVGDLQDADWFVRVVGNRVLLIPAAGWSRGGSDEAAPAAFSLGAADSSGLDTRVSDALQRVARATHILGMATTANLGQASAVDVQIDLVRFQDDTDRTGAVVPYGPHGRTLAVGDRVAFRLTNPTSRTIDTSLLFIDSSYGIHAVIPRPETADNRLPPGGTIQSERFTVTSATLGQEQVIAIAVQSPTMGPAIDFARFLTQPSLEQARGRAPDVASSPLGRLLQNAVYGQGAVRGIAPVALESYALRLLSWRTVAR